MTAINQSIVYLGQLNLGKMIRKIGEEEVVRILNIIMENIQVTEYVGDINEK